MSNVGIKDIEKSMLADHTNFIPKVKIVRVIKELIKHRNQELSVTFILKSEKIFNDLFPHKFIIDEDINFGLSDKVINILNDTYPQGLWTYGFYNATYYFSKEEDLAWIILNAR